MDEVLTQAFEGAGTVDRDAVTAYLKSHTFKTVIGEIDLRSQLQNIAYTVGQWQNGFFRSVAAVGVADSELVPVRAKSRLGVSDTSGSPDLRNGAHSNSANRLNKVWSSAGNGRGLTFVFAIHLLRHSPATLFPGDWIDMRASFVHSCRPRASRQSSSPLDQPNLAWAAPPKRAICNS